MCATTIITCVLAKLEEFLDIHVPRFEVGADGSLSLTALVNGYGCVVYDFQEWNNALALTVGALNVGTQRSHGCPVISETARKFREHCVVLNCAINAVKVVRYRRKVARAQLWAQRARVKQRWCRAHVVE